MQSSPALVPDGVPAQTASPATGLRRGSAAYRRVSAAFFLVGFAPFSLIYCVQPLLTEFTRAYGISAPQSALALSLTTGLLALSILLMSALGEGWPRRRLIFASMCGAALLTLLSAAAPSWPLFLLARAAEGVVLGGVPAMAMAFLTDLIDRRDLGRAMGLYVGGTAFGGMMGRVGLGLLTEFTPWRVALLVVGLLALLAAAGFRMLVPDVPARGDGSLRARDHLQVWRGHLSRGTLARLFLVGFVNLGVFVAVFNYLGFRLMAAPYHLSHAALSLLFTVYLFGVVASPVSGAVGDRFGRRLVLLGGLACSGAGLLLTLLPGLPAIILGIVLMTIGFFTTHSVASGWVGREAPDHRGHASALYLLAYYLGSSVVGLVGGWFWTDLGWVGVVGFTAALLLLALLGVRRLGDQGARTAAGSGGVRN